MTKYESLLQILIFIPIVMIFVVNHKGMLYDALCEKFNKCTKTNHTISWRNGKFWLAIPAYIFSKTDNIEIEKARTGYNTMSVLFWVTSLIVAILYMLK
jgi:hypothetical protein